jgi:curved DNA-binding protein CbpA
MNADPPGPAEPGAGHRRRCDMENTAFDPYATLGVAATATQDQITHAYRRKLRALHPDTRDASTPADPSADEQLRRIMAAYALLRDRVRRASFDRSSPSGAVRIPVRHGGPRWK